jgi:glycosyltransferase involved in cell wall biosynthesis
MPEAYPFAKEFRTAEMVKSIEDNIRAVDRVITTNEALIDYIIEKIKERYPGQTFGTTFHCQPLFIMPDLMKTEYTSITEKNKVKVLIIGDDYQFSDINFIKGILKDFKIKYKETGEIHIIGFDGKKHNKNYLQGLEFTHHPKVPFIKYFELIKHIGPDVLLIPANNSKFNATSKNYIKYLECAHMNIAVIAPNIPPYSKLITTNENGFLCPDKDSYLFQLDTMFTEPSKAAGTLGIAYATAVEYNITEAGNIEKMKKIYFPDHGKK